MDSHHSNACVRPKHPPQNSNKLEGTTPSRNKTRGFCRQSCLFFGGTLVGLVQREARRKPTILGVSPILGQTHTPSHKTKSLGGPVVSCPSEGLAFVSERDVLGSTPQNKTNPKKNRKTHVKLKGEYTGKPMMLKPNWAR